MIGMALAASVAWSLKQHFGARQNGIVSVVVPSNFPKHWHLGANVRTGKLWTWIDGRQLLIRVGAEPSDPNDAHLEIHGDLARADRRAGGERVRRLMDEMLALLSIENLRDELAACDTIADQQRLLTVLLALHPDRTAEQLELCVASQLPALELEAAKRLHGEQRRALLMRLVEVDHPYDGLRAEAIALLEPLLQPEEVHAIAAEILRGPPSLTRRAAIRLLGRFPPAEVPERLIDIAQHVQDRETAIELVDTIAAIGGERALRGLERLLGVSEVQAKALEALGRIGDRTSLIAIHEQLESLDRAGLRDATERAIHRIRDRLGAPDGGRLSVVDVDGRGEVSVVERAGELGLADD